MINCDLHQRINIGLFMELLSNSTQEERIELHRCLQVLGNRDMSGVMFESLGRAFSSGNNKRAYARAVRAMSIPSAILSNHILKNKRHKHR